MKLLSVFFIAILSVIVAGCDGDGDGGGGTTTTTEGTETVEETKAPLVLDSGSQSVGPDRHRVVSSFSVFETGIIEVRVEWTTGPSELDIDLVHDGGEEESATGESPVTLLMEATQVLLDISNGWQLEVTNLDMDLEAKLQYIVRFTPD